MHESYIVRNIWGLIMTAKSGFKINIIAHDALGDKTFDVEKMTDKGHLIAANISAGTIDHSQLLVVEQSSSWTSKVA